ncbi:hypothetical protein GVAV_000316 [Gurleya vavrai]
MDINMQNTILNEYHRFLAHGSASNMIYHLKNKYQWPGMYTQVHALIQNCQICQKGKQISPKTNFLMIETSNPGE